MIAGLDSSIDRPTPLQAAAMYANGVRVYGGYLPPGVGLASPWDRGSFQVLQAAGLRCIGFASGNDDPAQVAATAAAWGVLGCLDDEDGIRTVGSWEQAWLDASGFGIYGNQRVHGVRARFHVAALYPGSDPGATWPPGWAVPIGPLGWQWQGTHSEFGLSVDRSWFDDSFLPIRGGGMAAAPRPDGSQVDIFTVKADATVDHFTWTFAVGWHFQENLGGSLLPHTISAWWLGVELVAIGQAPDGSWVQIIWNGSSWGGWTPAGIGSTGLPPRGPAGPAGPQGPPGTVPSHSHPFSGTTGSAP